MLLFNVACESEDDDMEEMVALPAAVEDFIAANYAEYEIDESESDSLCTGEAVFEVELEKNDDDELELTFDSEGNLLFTSVEIETSALPTAVSNSIATNYPDYQIDEVERLDLVNGETQYEVEIENDPSFLELLMAADGTVICEEVDDDDE